MNIDEFRKQYPRVTRATVDGWLQENRPHLATYESAAGTKGIYHTGTGPAHSYRGLGQTWRNVLARLVVDAE